MDRNPQQKIIITAIFVFMFLACAVRAAVIDKIVVVVNNEIITQREIDVMLAPVYAQYKNVYKGAELIKKLEETREQIIKQLIEDRLILSEAKKADIKVEDKDVEDRLEDVRKKIGGDMELDNMLAQQNLTLNEMRARFREKIMIRKLIDRKVGARIIITPLEVKTYYNDHRQEFLKPEEIQLRQIVVKPAGTGKAQQDESFKKTKDLLKRLKDGCDFAGLAKEYSNGPNASEGGLMGYIKRGELMPQLEDIVFNLKDGECSNIIQSDVGYHIFKVEGRMEKRIMDFPEVRQEIEDRIYREKANQRLRGWIDSLAKNAYIEFK
jgi:parvulin-like peptidyl-prolyl isomerase